MYAHRAFSIGSPTLLHSEALSHAPGHDHSQLYVRLLTVPIVRVPGYYQIAPLGHWAYVHTEYSEPPISSSVMFRDAFVFEKRMASTAVHLLPVWAVFFGVAEPIWPLAAHSMLLRVFGLTQAYSSGLLLQVGSFLLNLIPQPAGILGNYL